MERIIDFRAPTFTVLADDLFTILSNHKGIQRLSFNAHGLIFTKEPSEPTGITICVETEQPLDRIEVIAFLTSPGIGFFGGDEWLFRRFEHWGDVFSINIDGDNVTLGEIRKKI